MKAPRSEPEAEAAREERSQTIAHGARERIDLTLGRRLAQGDGPTELEEGPAGEQRPAECQVSWNVRVTAADDR